MRTKVTLVLLFLNVALFFFIFTFVRKWQTDRKWEESRKRVLGPEVDFIQSLEISGGHLDRPVRLERRGDGWMLTKPIMWPANPLAVSRMLFELQSLEHESSFLVRDLAKSSLSLADYGLDEPQLALTFTAGPPQGAAGGRPPSTSTLRVGDTARVGNRLYVLSPDGERIHVVGRSLIDSLALTLDQIRSDTLFNIPLFEARSLSLQTAAPASLRIRLSRNGPRWSFEAPGPVRASKNDVELAINGLNTLVAKTLLDPATLTPDQTGLANPTLRITLEGNGRRETLLLGNPVTVETGAAPAAGAEPASPAMVDYYGKMEDKEPVFIVALLEALSATLHNAQETLRDRRVLDFDPSVVTSITIVAPNYPGLTLQRLETGRQPANTDPWQIAIHNADQALQTLPADLARVHRLNQKLYLLQVEKFVTDAPQSADLENWGFNRPQREITLNLAPAGTAAAPVSLGSTSLTLLIGGFASRQESGRVYVRLAGEREPSVYLVSAEILRETPVTARFYRDLLLRELPAGARITGLSLIDSSRSAALFTLKLAGDETWERALATEAPERRAALLKLIGQLSSLRAKNFVPPDAFPSAGVELADGTVLPWKYVLEITLTLVGGAGAEPTTEVSKLYFTERLGGGAQYAGSPEFNVVFEAGQELLDALFALTYGPQDPGPSQPVPVGQPSPAEQPTPAETP